MDKGTVLWYQTPADNFNSALPVGNGRIGGMVYGGTTEETINLNEDSIWSGGKRNRINPDAGKNLNKIRELYFAGEIKEAEELSMKTMTGVGPDSRHYMPLGNLKISMGNIAKINGYVRKLDLENAVCVTEFESNGIKYGREIFVSYPDQVMVIRVYADKPNSINLSAYIEGCDNFYDDNRPYNENTIIFTEGIGSCDGISFSAALSAKADVGKLCTVGGSIVAENADAVTLVFGARTNYRTDNYIDATIKDVTLALGMEYDELKQRHIQDYQSLYNRVGLSLCDNSDGDSERPTDKRILRLKANGYGEYDQGSVKYDNKLTELFFNFGRYFMISASRPGTLPMNLQGIWNNDINPKWGSRYCLNINLQMNYWCAENCNLSECHLPLMDYIEKIREDGKKTALEMYKCRGFVCHHNSDLWADTAPQDLYSPATIWPMGAAWLCLHIYDRYEYTQDIEFLKEKYATMKEAAEFFVDFMVEDNKGRLVTCPSLSPENSYVTPDKIKASISAGPAIDIQIITQLFNSVIKSAGILGRDEEFCEKLKNMMEKFPPIEVGKYGHIKEWIEDYDEYEAGHRHVSQLFGVFPGNTITAEKSPQLIKAARATLIRRLVHGGGHTGWSRAWIVNIWARLCDGEMVFENIQKLLSHSLNINMTATHPPFEVDGNIGGTAGIAESLMQSYKGEIAVLPALPNEWEHGLVKGLRARGGFEVSIKWENNTPVKVKILSLCGNQCKLRVHNADKAIVLCEKKEIDFAENNGALVFDTEKDKEYVVTFRS